jgi:hypothetical protein
VGEKAPVVWVVLVVLEKALAQNFLVEDLHLKARFLRNGQQT